MSTPSRGICLDSHSVRAEIEDVMIQGVDAHGLTDSTAAAIMLMSDEEIDGWVNQLVADDFWAVYDSTRSLVISHLVHLVEQQRKDAKALSESLDDDQQSDLDELVHDVASQIASDAINAGDQIDFLLSQGWTTEQIAQRLGADKNDEKE
jgi:hypothetical protein